MTEPGDLLLLEEVAEIARVSTDTVRFWVRQGKLPSLHPGRRRLIPRAALEAFLKQSTNSVNPREALR